MDRKEAPSPEHARTPHVVVLGGGFGGLWATRGLASAPVRITLVDRCNYHLFQPLLYQVATAGLAPTNIASPLRQILRRQGNVTVRMDEARAVDLQARRVSLADGELDYDYLVVATGSRTGYFDHDDWARHAPGLKTLQDAMALRARLLSAFEAAERETDPARRASWLNFVVVGGGPTGVELAGALAEVAHHTLPDEFRQADLSQARVYLVEAGDRLLAGLPEELSEKSRKLLEQLGVRVRLGEAVEAIDHEGIVIGEDRLASRTVIWAAGVQPSPLGRQLGASDEDGGRVKVAPDLSLPDHPEVFVVGDLAAARDDDGQDVPGVAQAAKQMGSHAARVIRDRLRNAPGMRFRYRDGGTLATLGRKAAVMKSGRLQMAGRTAWWLWLLTHLFFIVGFRNRFVVVFNTAWSRLTHQRHARLIIGRQDDMET